MPFQLKLAEIGPSCKPAWRSSSCCSIKSSRSTPNLSSCVVSSCAIKCWLSPGQLSSPDAVPVGAPSAQLRHLESNPQRPLDVDPLRRAVMPDGAANATGASSLGAPQEGTLCLAPRLERVSSFRQLHRWLDFGSSRSNKSLSEVREFVPHAAAVRRNPVRQWRICRQAQDHVHDLVRQATTI